MPENRGTAEILAHNGEPSWLQEPLESLVPVIYIIYDFFHLVLAMLNYQVIIDPRDNMVLECPFDNLVGEV